VETSSNKEEKSDLSVYVFAADLVHVVHRFRVSTGASTRPSTRATECSRSRRSKPSAASKQASKLYRYIDVTCDRSRLDANISESRRISLVTRDTQDISRLSFIPFSFLFFSFLFFSFLNSRNAILCDSISAIVSDDETRNAKRGLESDTGSLRVTRQGPMSMSMSNNLTAMACPRRGTVLRKKRVA